MNNIMYLNGLEVKFIDGATVEIKSPEIKIVFENGMTIIIPEVDFSANDRGNNLEHFTTDADEILIKQRSFFRDKSNEGHFDEGRTFHAAGIIVGSYLPSNGSGKDYAVKYFHPFKGTVEYQWRSADEIEVFECKGEDDVFMYEDILKKLEIISSIEYQE